MGLLTFVSRILGYVRDAGMARLFGLGPVLDAFMIAFRLPNLARRLFGEGALSTAFLPILTRTLQHEDRTEAWRLSSAIFFYLSLLLSVLVVVTESLLLYLRWGEKTDALALLLELTAILLPYVLFICLAAQVSSILHALGDFRWPSIVPIVLNLMWIVAIFHARSMDDWNSASRAKLVAWWIVSAGLLQLLCQLPALWAVGFRWSWDWGPSRKTLREVVGNTLTVVAGLSITQLNTLADSLIAWGFSDRSGYPMSPGAVSALYFGERMYQFPLGIFGVALGTVIFPLLSQHAARRDQAALSEDLTLGLKLVLAIGIPASMGLAVLAHPISQCLFEGGRFGPAESIRTSYTVACYGIGVWAYCGLLVIQRGFYAVGERVLPLRIGIGVVLVDVLLNLTSIWFLAEMGMALSTSLCAIGQLLILLRFVNTRIAPLHYRQLWGAAWRSLVASIGLGLSAYLLNQLLSPITEVGKFPRLMIASLGGVGVYAIFAWILGIKELSWLVRKPSEHSTPEIDHLDPK